MKRFELLHIVHADDEDKILVAGDDVAFGAREAFVKHIGDNVTHRHGLHPSVLRYEREIPDFVKRLVNAPPDGRATATTGGSESLFLAMKAADCETAISAIQDIELTLC
ncbi:hypothetical protein ACFL1S_06615 [Pseudomonadota bacterium]